MVCFLVACATEWAAEPSADPVGALIDSDAPQETCTLRINEAQAQNDSTWMDADFGFPDWVELYNPGGATVARLMVDDQLVWSGDVGAGERLLVETPLDADGARIELAAGDTVCDRLATGQMGRDTAWARVPDGGEWAYTGRATPGWTNGSDPHPSGDPSEVLFPEDQVTTFTMTLSDAAIASLEADPYGEVEASLAWGPAWFRKVGVRLKGVYGSLRTPDGKAAFKIDLNAFEDHHLRGLKSLTFNNMVQDPSYVHESLAYAFYRSLGMPAPRTAWMRLVVNGEDWGLYLHVESVDDTFLARWYGDPDGRLYEGAYGVDFYLGYETSFEYDEGPEIEDRSDLTAVATILAGDASDAAIAELDSVVDIDQFLEDMAIESILLHWDGYTTSNNYRVYHDPSTDRFQIIPWGTDQTFHDEMYGPYDGYGAVLVFCLRNEGCAARYEAALDQVADDFDATPLETWMDDALALIGEDIATDWRGEFGADTIESYQQTTRDVIRTGAARIRRR